MAFFICRQNVAANSSDQVEENSGQLAGQPGRGVQPADASTPSPVSQPEPVRRCGPQTQNHRSRSYALARMTSSMRSSS